ncbi:MAG: hypothetical protein SOT81_09710 [Treponema sp.]|nr:hypothetical protein [Treponema sp.]
MPGASRLQAQLSAVPLSLHYFPCLAGSPAKNNAPSARCSNLA